MDSQQSVRIPGTFWILIFLVIGASLFLFKVQRNSGASNAPNVIAIPTTDRQAASESTSVGQTPQKVEIPIALLTPDEEKKKILQEILESKNDNDPRMDTELATLSESTKEVFKNYYSTLPAEKRNERGTIIFLLGRNLSRPEDFKFLENVLTESACLSLNNCSRKNIPGGDHEDAASGLQITLAYPQIVALNALESYMAQSENNSHLPLARQVLDSAKQSKTPVVQKAAWRLSEKLNK